MYTRFLKAKRILQQSLRTHRAIHPHSPQLDCRGTGRYHGHYATPFQTKLIHHDMRVNLGKKKQLAGWQETYKAPKSPWKLTRAATLKSTGLDLSTRKKTRHIPKAAKAYQRWQRHADAFVPSLLLQRMLRRPIGLYWSHQVQTARGVHDVIIAVSKRGKLRQLVIAQRTHLVQRVQSLLSHPIHGDGLERFRYTYPKTTKGAGDTHHISHHKWGGVNRQWRCHWAQTKQAQTRRRSKQTNTKFPLHKVAKGLYILPLASNHRVLIVEFARYLGIVEAPANAQTGQYILDQAKRHFPKKPIKYLFLTHHHPDHAGGLRPFVRAGATIVTTAGNQALFQHMLRTPRALDAYRTPQPKRASTSTSTSTFAFVNKRRVFQGKTMRVDAFDVGTETHHTKEHLIYYFPQQQIVFQGDLGNLYAHKKRLPNKRTKGLYQSILKRKLHVKNVIQSWPRKYTRRLIPFVELKAFVTPQKKHQ